MLFINPPLLAEDYLVLSTVHSAKGQEWDAVFVLNVADGNFPSEFAAGHEEQLEEERRLVYVAMTRARDQLHLVEPQRYYVTQQSRRGDAHVYGARSRFLTDAVLATLDRGSFGGVPSGDGPPRPPPASPSTSARGFAGCGSGGYFVTGLRKRSVKRSLSPMARYFSRSRSPSRRVGGSVHTTLVVVLRVLRVRVDLARAGELEDD